jgi:hypothetical protein
VKTKAIYGKMLSRCVECDHLLVDDEVKYLYRGKSYCGDCYRAAKKLQAKQRIMSYEKYGLRTTYERRSLKDWRCAIPDVL